MSEWPGSKLGMGGASRQIVAMRGMTRRYAERMATQLPFASLTLLTLVVVVIAAPAKAVASHSQGAHRESTRIRREH